MRVGFLILMMFVAGAFTGLLTVPCRAQEQEEQQQQRGPDVVMEAPPPMKYIPQAERARLAAARDAKARLRLGLELIEEHLENAERLTNSGQCAGAAAELGIYHALIEDTLGALCASTSSSSSSSGGSGDGANDKRRDLFKLMELTLRAQASRLEAMRRVTPFDEAAHVKATYEYVWAARTEALNAFYGEQVVTEEAVLKKKNAREADALNSFSRLDAAFALLADKASAPAAIPILIELLKDTDAFIRLDAAYGLGFIGPQASVAVPHLLVLLRDQEAMVRNNAAYALGLIGADADRVVPELVKLIRDRDARVRFNAAEAIGRFGRAAVPALTRATENQK